MRSTGKVWYSASQSLAAAGCSAAQYNSVRLQVDRIAASRTGLARTRSLSACGKRSGWNWLDPTIALLVAANIVKTGWVLLHRSAAGLMDAALPEVQQREIEAVLAHYRGEGLDFHALLTRQAGARAFVSVHVLVPGAWTVQQGHDWLERIEADIRAAVPNAHVLTHLEPLEDPLSAADRHLDRSTPSPI